MDFVSVGKHPRDTEIARCLKYEISANTEIIKM